MPALVRVSNVRKVYEADGEPVIALQGVSFEVDPGEFLALMEPSGCGKSTLLHIIGAMDRPTTGEAWIEDMPIHSLPEEDLTNIRRSRVGFVFQFFHSEIFKHRFGSTQWRPHVSSFILEIRRR